MLKNHLFYLLLLSLPTAGVLSGCNGNASRTEPKAHASFNDDLGKSSKTNDLESIFLSLPDDLCGSMTVDGRKRFIADARIETVNHRYDPVNRYINYYSDGEDGTGAKSAFFIKVFPATRFQYVVFIHLVKPIIPGLSPSPEYTCVLAPSNDRWIDVTDQVLPKEVSRDWYFQPIRQSNLIQAGRYIRRGNRIVIGPREIDLKFDGDRFFSTPSPTKEYTIEY